eukprot:Hpha_TRINITY_DN20623_c0_g1::TRINITY_DN20623_c0_g1_i1::g.148136::m.148136
MPAGMSPVRCVCLVVVCGTCLLLLYNEVLPSIALPTGDGSELPAVAIAHADITRRLERLNSRMDAYAARPRHSPRPSTPTPPPRDGVRVFSAAQPLVGVFVPLESFRRVRGGQREGATAFDVCGTLKKTRGIRPDGMIGFEVVGSIVVRVSDTCAATYLYDAVGIPRRTYSSKDGRVTSGVNYWELHGSGPADAPTDDWIGNQLPPIELPPADRSPEGEVRRDERGRPLVAYAITVTKDGSYVDGAAVMAHSVLQVHKSSKYGVELVAFLKPGCDRTKRQLRALARAGQDWRILERTAPIELKRTPPIYQAEAAGGCCGVDELIKLYAWTLTEYHRVAHLDADTILLRNIDDVLSRPSSLAYTHDWGMANAMSRLPPVQGGFLVVRPDWGVFKELQRFAQRGRFRPD